MEDNTLYAPVVDDDALIRMDAVGILEDAGFRVLEAFDVDSAIRELEQSGDEIQLLFTDGQMPGSRNGFALARACANGWPHIKILVASGQARPNENDMPAQAVSLRNRLVPALSIRGLSSCYLTAKSLSL